MMQLACTVRAAYATPAAHWPCCPAVEPAAASGGGGGGWFGGWFSGGGSKEEEKKPAAPTDLSEDRFAPPPMPHFGSAPEPQFR